MGFSTSHIEYMAVFKNGAIFRVFPDEVAVL
jgi:hypothetical protein